jgi:hypothetical protein
MTLLLLTPRGTLVATFDWVRNKENSDALVRKVGWHDGNMQM